MKNYFENIFTNLDNKQGSEKIEKKNINNHLESGFKPIIACVGTQEQFTVSNQKLENENERKAYEVDFYGRHKDLIDDGFKNPEFDSYVISPVDSFDKYSKDFFDCTGLLVSGYYKSIKRNISFMSHESPDYFLYGKANTNEFIKDIDDSLKKIKSLSKSGSIDAVILGGNFFKKGQRGDFKSFQEHYIKSIKILTNEVEKILGFEPIVIIGPKNVEKSDNVYFDNNERRLYISRPEVGNETTDSFLPSDLKEKLEKI